MKFWVKVEEILYYLCSENKGADQLCLNIGGRGTIVGHSGYASELIAESLYSELDAMAESSGRGYVGFHRWVVHLRKPVFGILDQVRHKPV